MDKKTFLFLAMAWTACCAVRAQLVWGDQGNGTYINPILNEDFSDPDVIRVGDRYYMVASDFNYMGMQVLESEDMVNWQLVSQVYREMEGYDTMEHYAKGSWAPAISYQPATHTYYVYFCTPEEGLFMSTAADPHGPWTPLHCVKRIKGWEDPCPFWDEDGKAYLGHSRVGAGPIIVHRMSADGRELSDDGVTVYTGPVAEGTKIMKRDGWYYLVIPEGGVGTGWQTVLRSRSIYGPYEKKVILEQGITHINGPHQGNLVSTPDGKWWFFHFQDTQALGRVVHLQPVQWIDGWPMAGVDQDMNGIGEPVYVFSSPKEGKRERMFPQHSDDFSGDVLSYKGQRQDALGLQWQWNHNPVDDHWSLTERKGWLTLHALPADKIKAAKNTLTQKTVGYESEAVTQVDASALGEGTRAGVCVLGNRHVAFGVTRQDGTLRFYTETCPAIRRLQDEQEKTELLGVAAKRVFLKVHAEDCWFQFYYSTDGKTYHKAGNRVEVRSGNWKGPRLGLYCYGSQGTAHFNFFHYSPLR